MSFPGLEPHAPLRASGMRYHSNFGKRDFFRAGMSVRISKGDCTTFLALNGF